MPLRGMIIISRCGTNAEFGTRTKVPEVCKQLEITEQTYYGCPPACSKQLTRTSVANLAGEDEAAQAEILFSGPAGTSIALGEVPSASTDPSLPFHRRAYRDDLTAQPALPFQPDLRLDDRQHHAMTGCSESPP